MNTQDAWSVLFNLPVGTIVAWASVVIGILTGTITATIKLYKTFLKLKSAQDENEHQKEKLIEHDKTLKEINNSLKAINNSLAEQKEVNLKQVRYQIVHTCDEAISAGNISAGKLKSLEELFEEYVEIFHGNGYVKTIMKKVRQLPVYGNLDE